MDLCQLSFQVQLTTKKYNSIILQFCYKLALPFSYLYARLKQNLKSGRAFPGLISNLNNHSIAIFNHFMIIKKQKYLISGTYHSPDNISYENE